MKFKERPCNQIFGKFSGRSNFLDTWYQLQTEDMSTRIRISCKMYLFLRIKRCLRPHKERFRKYPRPHEDAAIFKFRYSDLDKRKKQAKCPHMIPKISAHAVIRSKTMQ